MVLGMHSGGDSLHDLNIFLNAFQVTFPVLLDVQSAYTDYNQSGVSPFPLDYVIDQNGDVAYFATEYDPESMQEVIDGLLGGEVAVEPQLPPRNLDLIAWPNPFNPQTDIAFGLPRAATVSLTILDARGHILRRLIDSERRSEGDHVVGWDGTDDQGRSLPTGVYFARLEADAETVNHKLTLIR